MVWVPRHRREPSGDGGEAQVPNLVGYGPRTGTAKRRPRRGAGDGPVEAHEQVADTFSTHAPVSRRADDREPLHAEQDTPTGAPLPGPGETAPAPTPSGGAVLAKPPVRKLAKDLGVDLGSLVGSGPGGVITRDDVTAASKRVETSRGRSALTPVEAVDAGAARTSGSRSRACASRRRRRWCARRSPRRTSRCGWTAT